MSICTLGINFAPVEYCMASLLCASRHLYIVLDGVQYILMSSRWEVVVCRVHDVDLGGGLFVAGKASYGISISMSSSFPTVPSLKLVLKWLLI